MHPLDSLHLLLLLPHSAALVWEAHRLPHDHQHHVATLSLAGVASTGADPDDERRFLEEWYQAEGSYSLAAYEPVNRTFRQAAPSFNQCADSMVENAARNCGGAGCSVVFVGDSITEFLSGHFCYAHEDSPWPMALEDAVPKSWRPLLLAGGGDQTQHTLGHLDRCLPVLQTPELFIVMIGTNNLGPVGRFNAEQTVKGILAVLNSIRAAHPSAPIMLHAILPRQDGGPELAELVDETNVLLQAIDMPNIVFIDCGYVFPKEKTAMHELMPDLLHPNREGYQKWLQCLKPQVQQYLGKKVASTE